MSLLSRLRLDPLIIGLVLAAIIASIFPLSGVASDGMRVFTQACVALLFFLHGARLLPQTVLAGLANWRLHLTIIACSFVMFPLMALPISLLVPTFMPPELFVGFVFLCILPSTIQSSIAFTSIAGGNVSAAVVAASASNMLGVFLTPLLATLILHSEGGVNIDAIESVAMQLLAPFVLGQLTQKWVGGWVRAHPKTLKFVERGSIICVAYLAFSDAMAAGAWQAVTAMDVFVLVSVVSALLAAVLLMTRLMARRLGFSREDEIAIVFCGSKKSMGSGLPMANIIFAGQTLGLLILPMMLYHQIQLIVCAFLAQAYARSSETRALKPAPDAG